MLWDFPTPPPGAAVCSLEALHPLWAPLTSMEKRRWLWGWRYCMPGDGRPSSSPLSVGDRALGSGWGSPPRGLSCRSESGQASAALEGAPSNPNPCPNPQGGGEGVGWALTLIPSVVQLGELLRELSQ